MNDREALALIFIESMERALRCLDEALLSHEYSVNSHTLVLGKDT